MVDSHRRVPPMTAPRPCHGMVTETTDASWQSHSHGATPPVHPGRSIATPSRRSRRIGNARTRRPPNRGEPVMIDHIHMHSDRHDTRQRRRQAMRRTQRDHTCPHREHRTPHGACPSSTERLGASYIIGYLGSMLEVSPKRATPSREPIILSLGPI
jgi:hypothetical protein